MQEQALVFQAGDVVKVLEDLTAKCAKVFDIHQMAGFTTLSYLAGCR